MSPSVAVVVVTFNRKELLRRCLSALQAQTQPADEIVVVDNASTDGTRNLINEAFSSVTYVRLPENVGASGGVVAGLTVSLQNEHDYCLVLDDDAQVAPNALEKLINFVHAREAQGDGIDWLSAGGYASAWKGRPIPAKWGDKQTSTNGLVRVDCADLNRSVISRRVFEKIGLPRHDYFLMMWNIEYSLRAGSAGIPIWRMPTDLISHSNASVVAGHSQPWRGYYQTRNHLAMALERKSAPEVFWWAMRQAKLAAGTVLRSDRKLERLRLRALGALDGLRGRMGKTIDPATYNAKQRH